MFKGHPKAGKAVLIKVDKKLSAIIDFQYPDFISLDAEEFKELDKVYQLSEFFKGDNLENSSINTKNMISAPQQVYERLKHQKDESFLHVAGLYEEYYFEKTNQQIRSDYIQINEDGTAWMMGRRAYEGFVKAYDTKITLSFKSKDSGAHFPVNYMLH